MRSIAIAVLCSSLLCVPAFAEDETPFRAAAGLVGSVFDLGNIIVGGRRLGSPFRDFVSGGLSSTSAVTRRDIELSGVRNIPEVFDGLPGVVLTDLSGNGEEPALDFRGFNQGRDTIFTLDGVRLNEPKSNTVNFPLIPVRMLERVEVSRGGSSFLYGEGALGAVANLVTPMPEEPGVHGRAETLAGSFGAWGQSVELSARREGFGAYVSGDITHERGFRQNSAVDKNDLYTKFLWDPSEQSRLTLSALYAWAELGRSGSIRESRLRALGPEATERPRNFAELDSSLVSERFELKPMENLVVSQNLFFRRASELSVANFATFDTNDNELDLETDSWGGTLQVNHSQELGRGVSEDLLIGAEYQDDDVDEEDFSRSKTTLLNLAQTVDSSAEKGSTGVFAKLTLDWEKFLGAYYGARYDEIHFRNTDRLIPGNSVPSDLSKTSHSAGVSVQLTPQWTATAAYSRSFRAPTLSDLYANPLFGSNPALEPEDSTDTEAGLKWQDGTSLLKTSLFLNRRENEIGFDPNRTDATHLFGSNSNFGETQRVGVETALETRPRPWLELKASHAYTEATFGKNTPTAQLSGDHIPMIPRNRFTAGVRVRPVTGLDLGLDMVSVSKQVLTNDITNDRNGRRLPAYTVFDLQAVYAWKGWEFSFEVRNLFDEEYEGAGSLGAAPSAFNTDRTVEDNFFVPAPGRSYGGAIRCRW